MDWIPKVDATVVTRILDAGGAILGKAACENNSKHAMTSEAEYIFFHKRNTKDRILKSLKKL